MKLLVINPNSSIPMTGGLMSALSDLEHSGLVLKYFTGPSSSPPSINDFTTSILSAARTFDMLYELVLTSADDDGYDAYLVACFSDHPLVGMLREHTHKPVLGIFEASIMQALALGDPFGIVTTGKYWEAALTAGVKRIFGSADFSGKFVGVQSTGMSAAELHEVSQDVVADRIAVATSQIVARGARTVILGCAGMSGMEDAARRGRSGVDIRIIDATRSGVTTLEGLVRAQRL
ncbi:Asp/Glu/hydantoin racemase [Cubamyces menziesii]|nr:Asp/Glu/hydantoin racemase [Cubamyces menziesii]